MINNAHLKKMHLTNISYERIDSKYQNSAILKGNNPSVKVAEIFSFGTAMHVDIAMKNLMKVNETFVAIFSITTSKHNHVQMGSNIGPEKLNLTSNSYNPISYAVISSSNWYLEQPNLTISWKQEFSIFHDGIIQSSPSGNKISLPFGPISLSTNETYSIDPTISPMIVIAPGGGGGGSDSSFPVGTSSYIYDSNGIKIGLISQSACAQSEYETTVPFCPTIASSFSPVSGSDWTVNNYLQSLCWIGNSAGSPYEMHMSVVENYYQNHVDQYIAQMQTVLTVITDIANAAGLPIPDLAYFLQYSSGVSTATLSNGIQTSANAGFSAIPCDFGNYYYNSLGYPYGPWYDQSFQDSYIFGDLLQNSFTAISVGGTQTDPVINYFVFSATIGVSNGGLDGPLYTGSASLYFNIGQFNI
ncbi:MAG: hypothetical protein ACYCSA_10155 [Thermoplasmataceae archaeon]